MEKLPETAFPSAALLDKYLQRKTPPSKSFKDRTSDVFTAFRELVMSKPHNRCFTKPTRVSPAEFITAAVLIEQKMKVLSMSQISQAITLMREDVRSQHSDIRANTRCMKTMLSFITKDFPAFKKIGANEKTMHPLVQAARASATRGGSTSSTTANNPTDDKGKRKRAGSSDSSDSEHEPLSRKTPVSSPIKKAARTVPGSTSAGVPSSSKPSGSIAKLAPIPKKSSSQAGSI